jgi:hypothetical protein
MEDDLNLGILQASQVNAARGEPIILRQKGPAIVLVVGTYIFFCQYTSFP